MDFENIVIREVTNDDEPLICEFFDNMGPYSRSLFNRRDYNKNGILKFIRKPDKTRKYFLALIDGKMAGYVFFLDFNTSIPSLGIAVRDELQGKGLGKKLMLFAEDFILKSGKGGIQLTTHIANLRAQTLYESVGFVCTGLCKNGTEFSYLFRFKD